MEMGQEVAVAGTSKAAPVSIGAPPPPPQPPTLLAPGFRFHPTDEELVTYYLRRKVCRKTFRFQAVTEIDVYKSEPWELSEYSSLKTRDLEWYFFSPVDKKYGNGSRLNRATGKGYWKATGKDRCVRHKNQTIGMKKTLVFHSGRAPDGKRTNWVMHEYRLCDSELEASGVVQEKDVFVLCRIFQKSGLGPPNGNRYAPFVEEEWDEDAPLLVPGGDNEEDVANSDGAQVECTDLDQMSLSIAPPQVENPTESNNFPLMSKRDRSGEPENLSLAESKRSKHVNPNPNNVNGSDDSTTSSQEPSSTVIMTKMTSPSTPVEIPFLPMPSKGNPPSSLITFDSSNLEKLVPPGYLKFIGNLENEILNSSMEKESLKIELMRAQAMINMLQSHIDELTIENEAFRNFRR